MKNEKKEALAEFHRNAIQSAAEKLFLEKGVDAASVDEIAEAAGYSKATLYVYFKSKADIWDHILFSAMKTLKENVVSAVAPDCPARDKYFAMCGAIADFSDEHPLYFESLMDAIPYKEGVSRKTYEVGEEIIDEVGKLLAQGINEGLIDPNVKIPHITAVLWSCLSGMIRMINRKEDYFKAATDCDKKELLRYGFETLLKSVTKQPRGE